MMISHRLGLTGPVIIGILTRVEDTFHTDTPAPRHFRLPVYKV